MEKLPNIDKLNEAIAVAEKVLEDIENEDSHKANRKKKRVNRALENAYAILNLKDYTEKEIKDRTDEIWKSLVDDDPIAAFFLFLVGFSLSGIMIFTVYQAYSFFDSYQDKDPEHFYETITKDKAGKIEVEYAENNVISLYDQMSVADKVGLQNKPQQFTITNRLKGTNRINYGVNYTVFLEPLNDPNAKLLKEEHIKLKYTYTDSDGSLHESNIMTIKDLPKSRDGKYILVQDSQKMNSKTDFNVIFWISSHARDDEQGSSYTFKFNVEAEVGNMI